MKKLKTMNREIKFRAWDNDDKEIYYPIVLARADGIKFKPLRSCKDGNTAYKYHTLMQFTGLKDKNGKEIYEGDIVKAAMMYHGKPTTEFTAYIIYNENLGSFRIAYDSLGGGSQDEIYFKHQIEVIGNIYQNPELLNK